MISPQLRAPQRSSTRKYARLSVEGGEFYLRSLAQEGLGMGTLDTDELTNIVLPQVILGLSRPVDD